MDCAKVKEFLYRFIDNEADGEVIAHIEQHLKDCPLCDNEINKEKKLDCLIREHFPRDTAPAHLQQAIARKLKLRERRRRVLLSVIGGVILIAAIVCWLVFMP